MDLHIFNNINKTNKSISIYYTIYDIRNPYLKLLLSNINRIKRLILNITTENPSEKDLNAFFETFFSIKDISNDLIYLKIECNKYNKGSISSNLFEKINDFKLLKYLYIKNLNFNGYLCLNLNKLNLLSVYNCNIIYALKNAMNKELKVLNVYSGNISNLEALEKSNSLEILKLTKIELSNINILEKVNFKELIIIN